MSYLHLLEKFYQNLIEQENEIIIIEKENSFSYKDVNEISNYYASILQQKMNPDNRRVGLLLSHSSKIIISIIAVLKAGKSFVPINKNLKAEDIGNILEIAEITCLISDDIQFNYNDINIIHYADNQRLCLNQKFTTDYDPNNEAYLLFTSGSSGIPKGCSVNYNNLNYIIKNMQDICPVSKKSVYLFSTPYFFDVSITEIFSWVYQSAVCVLDLSDFRNYNNSPDLFYQYRITHFAASPSTFLQMLNNFNNEELDKMFHSLEFVMLAGEAFKYPIFEKWQQSDWNFRLFNLYGPTESTVYAIYHELLRKNNYFEHKIPIGYPLTGCHFDIINIKDGIGELVLLGDGVCDGYINNPRLNKEKFYYDSTNQKAYKTGDLVSIGNYGLEYCGRFDDQIQVNGIRVELGDIENRISRIAQVNSVGVAFYQNKILANIVLENNLSRENLHQLLSAHLPRYMLPNYIEQVNEIKLTQNNKTDRKFIVENYISKSNKTSQENGIPVKKGILGELLNIVKVQTQNDNIAITDDIFELGINSLDVFNIANKLERTLLREIDIDLFYTQRTIEKIVENLNVESRVNASKPNDINISEKYHQLNKDIISFFDSRDEKILTEYPSIHIQHGYYFEKFNSVITFSMKLGTAYSEQQVIEAITRLIHTNSILRSKLIVREKQLIFQEFEFKQVIPLVDLTELDYNGDIIAFIENNYKATISLNRYTESYLSLFVILRFKNNIVIVGGLDHCIADFSTINVIKHKITNALSHKLQNENNSYELFCKGIIAKNTPDTIISSAYINELIKTEVEEKENILDSLKDGKFVLSLSNYEKLDNADMNIFISYTVAKSTIEKLGVDSISARTLFNIRDYHSYRFKNTIGDIHVGISFILRRNEDYDSYVVNSKRIIELFATENFRPSYIFHFNKNEYLNTIKEKISNANIMSINYLGEIKETELDREINEMYKLQCQMYNITKNIYITAYTVNEKLYILSNKDIF
ncbi:amino acid adenylation domain-containing protein [Nicoletella semolina]|uniref:Amino acid adenylation domain-containing protein n=1 Tax=Nicoletella semolina TaxID=271160 RepID=A0A4R2N9Y4_9PAST|nr:non-ribosomal peptide synthetase [Nicoletella semolina]MDH2925323.1 hypothetical protein [Nicoletella semolina]TCP17800.1 amino acid adenylation domain-containing protein [Nicoletella semolina]